MSTILAMPKPKPEQKPEPKSKPTSLRLPSDILRATREYADSHEWPPDTTEIVTRALREFLEKRGYLPKRKQ